MYRYANGRIAKRGDIVVGPGQGVYQCAVVCELGSAGTEMFIFTFGTEAKPLWPNYITPDEKDISKWVHIDDLAAGAALLPDTSKCK